MLNTGKHPITLKATVSWMTVTCGIYRHVCNAYRFLLGRSEELVSVIGNFISLIYLNLRLLLV